ncbi:hypothetical protein [Phenylobacterium sp.]|uniref:hypothetical protein n=1 Tax=Phenylobacterium sp. TaxID=1871053 RepID=UPI0025E5928D|nr:hypothetical protein [Phenylobacterium sp.]
MAAATAAAGRPAATAASRRPLTAAAGRPSAAALAARALAAAARSAGGALLAFVFLGERQCRRHQGEEGSKEQTSVHQRLS